MKKLLCLLILSGCGPYFLDVTASIGANQKIAKTLNVDQKQTDAQVNANADIIDHIINIIPYVARATPSPTPVPLIKSITLNLVDPTPTPTATTRPKAAKPKLKPPAPCPSTNGVFKDYEPK